MEGDSLQESLYIAFEIQAEEVYVPANSTCRNGSAFAIKR